MRTISGLILSLVVLAGINAGAQSVRSVAAQGAAVSNSTLSIDRKITVRFEVTPLHDALQAIAKQSSAQISYRQETLPSKHRVTMNVTDISARNVLKMMLKNTGVEMSVTSTGEVALYREAEGKSQAQGVIVGKVTDSKSGRGIAGANVSLDNDARGVVSDENGAYRISGVSVGNHTVVVRLVGYAKQTRTISVDDGVSITVDFKLEPSASVLDQVVVTGTVIASELKSVPNAITVITAKQIEERGITRIDQLFRGDIPGLFSLELGTAGSDGGASLDEVIVYSRGATKISTAIADASGLTNPIKTYIDGIELADPKYLSQLDPKSIERIEVLTGPQASTIYGANAINGVMQIFTKRGNTLRPRINLSFAEGFSQNNFSSALATSHQYDGGVSGMAGNLSYNFGGGWDYTGAWSPGKQMQRTNLYGGGRYQTGSLAIDINARQGWTRNRIQGGSNQVITAMIEAGEFSPPETFVAGRTTPSKLSLYGKTLGLTLSYAPLSWWSHQLTAGSDGSNTENIGSEPGFTYLEDTSIFNNQTINSKVSQAYSSTLKLSLASPVQASLVYGADHRRSRYSTVGWSIVGQSIVSPSINRGKPDKNSGVYAQGQLGLWDALFLTYGVRTDWNPNFGEKAKTHPGRYGISYSREFGLISAKIRGSYGRSIRPPNAGNKLGSFGNISLLKQIYGDPYLQILPSPELGPEFQQGGEGGMELYIGNRGSLIVTRYNQTVDGLIAGVQGADSLRALRSGPGPNPFCRIDNLRSDGYCYLIQSQNLNVGSIRNQGWELQGSARTGPFTVQGTYSWTKSRVIGVTQKYRALLSSQLAFSPGRSFNYTPEHTWVTNLSYSQYGTSVLLNLSGLGTTLRSANGDLALLTESRLRIQYAQALRMNLPDNYRQSQADYVIANINSSHQFSGNVDGTLQITNLMNSYKNDVSAYNPTIGRQTRLGLRWRIN